MISYAFIHYTILALITALTGLGVALGQGFATQTSLQAANRQPAALPDIARSQLISLALIETSAILGAIFSLLLFFRPPTSYYGTLAELGIGLALALPGFTVGLVSAQPTQEALKATARQPFLSKKITNFMLLVLSLLQTPLIFGFLIALLIRSKVDGVSSLNDALRLIGAGACIGLGSLGPAVGSGRFTKMACKSIGMNTLSYQKIFSFTLVSQALIETPVLFSGILAIMIVVLSESQAPFLLSWAAALCMALGTFGPGIGSSRVASQACQGISLKPELYPALSRASLITQALIDTCSIYAFIIALLILMTTF